MTNILWPGLCDIKPKDQNDKTQNSPLKCMAHVHHIDIRLRNIFMYKYDMVAIGTCELERIFFKENDIVNRRHGV